MKTPLIIVVCTLLVATFYGNASPAPGCADPIPASTWYGQWSAAGDSRDLRVGDGLTYSIVGSSADQIWPDSTGQWDWMEPYCAHISLTNAPGTPWYSAGDTNVSFDFDTSLLLKIRGPEIPSTNPANAYLEMELSAQDGRFIFLASYAGIPNVTYVPESPPTNGLPGCLPYTESTAPLSWARLCIDSAEGDPSIPLAIRGLLAPSFQVELCWTSVSNKLYQLQCCSDLSEQQWTNLGTPIAATGATRRAVDTAESQRFFRILEFP